MKLMPQTLHGHVLHETADAKKQQAGQQLVHEAPQWVGAQRSGWVVVARTRVGKITQRSMTSERNVAHPGCLFATFPGHRIPSGLDSWTTSKMLQLFNGPVPRLAPRNTTPQNTHHFATRSLVLRDNKMKTLNGQVKK